MTEHHDTAKHVIDGLSLITVLGTLLQWLPAAAAFASLVWSLIRIYETKTVQAWLGNQEQDNG
jgi:hypothetical protein